MPDHRSVTEDEVLTGAQAIAVKFGFTRRQVYHWIETKNFPAFKIGDLVCARPAQIRRWLADQERASATGSRDA